MAVVVAHSNLSCLGFQMVGKSACVSVSTHAPLTPDRFSLSPQALVTALEDTSAVPMDVDALLDEV